jgi:hypothetical protein
MTDDKVEYSVIRIPYELIKKDSLEERFNRYWADWQKMCPPQSGVSQ